MSEPPDVNIRSPSYFIARSWATCGKCRKRTTVVALAVPPGHEVFDAEAEDHAWQVSVHNAFLFHIDYLSAGIRRRMDDWTPMFQRGPSETDGGPGFSNHCERCGCRLEDDGLFCEPEAAFFPVSDAMAKTILLTPVNEPFRALVGGYCPEPEFFDAISRD